MVATRLCVAALLLLLCGHVAAEVAMVFSVQRHGARNVLVKTPFLTESDAFGGPALLPQGQRMCYNAGTNYASRYLNSTCATQPVSTCLLRWAYTGSTNGNAYGLVNSSGVGFNNYNTLFTSSALDRTLESAQSFLAGIFPALPVNSATEFIPTGQQVVPVYTHMDENDYIIRSYTKCPAYDDTLAAWYGSAEFQTKEALSSPLRDAVSKLYPDTDTSLINWWNVYDSFNTWNKYQLGNNLTVPPDVMSNMTDLAYWLEVTKMRSNMTRSLLGGPMLDQLSQYLQAAASTLTTTASDSQNFGLSLSMYQLLGFSAHYNTQLGVLAALRLDTYWPALLASTQNGASWLATGSLPAMGIAPKLPALAAVVAFELHVPGSASTPGSLTSADQMAVRLVIQDGPSTPYIVVPMPCQTNQSSALGGPEACPLPAFLSYVQGAALSEGAWCSACRNNNMTFCALAAALSGDAGGYAGWDIAVAVVVSVVGTALLLVGIAALWQCSRRTAAHSQKLLHQKEMLAMSELSTAKEPAI